MAIAFRAVGTVKKATTGSLSAIVLPTGHVANDILECSVICADNATGAMSGWTQKLGLNNGTGARFELWWKRDNGSESAPTITRTGTAIASMCWIKAYSGVDSGLADPWRDSQSQTGTGTALGNFTITCPALTGVVSGDFRTAFVGLAAQITDGSGIFATPTGFTESPTDQNQSGGVDGCAGAGDHLLATGSAGSITSLSSWNGTNIPAWFGIQSALSSATSGAVVLPPLPFVVDTAVARASNW